MLALNRQFLSYKVTRKRGRWWRVRRGRARPVSPVGRAAGLQKEAGARGVVQMTAQSQRQHTARWAQWGSVIGKATFALWGCSANVRL